MFSSTKLLCSGTTWSKVFLIGSFLSQSAWKRKRRCQFWTAGHRICMMCERSSRFSWRNVLCTTLMTCKLQLVQMFTKSHITHIVQIRMVLDASVEGIMKTKPSNEVKTLIENLALKRILVPWSYNFVTVTALCSSKPLNIETWKLA